MCRSTSSAMVAALYGDSAQLLLHDEMLNSTVLSFSDVRPADVNNPEACTSG